MIRSSQHTIKFSNDCKLELVDMLFQDYHLALQKCIDLIISKQLPLKKWLSTKDIPTLENISGGQWKSIIYKDASEIVRSRLTKVRKQTFKKFQILYAKCKENNRHQKFLNKRYRDLNINLIKRIGKIKIKNVSISLNTNFWNSTWGNSFDEFIEIRLPYIRDGYKNQRIPIRIPIKQHKHSLKYKNWIRKNTIRLSKHGITFFYEKEIAPKQPIKSSIGIDIGYKKLLSTSSNNYYGIELQKIYAKLSKQKQGSKNFKQTLIERDNLINKFCNDLFKTEGFDQIFVEDLKYVKRKSKYNKKVMNKLQRWSYSKAINKLERLSEEKGFQLTKVDPSYTSQTCSNCGLIDKSNRKGETYRCKCGIEINADYNAAINILHRGIYSSSVTKNDFTVFDGKL